MRLHASCVAHAGKGILITGSAGSGKSFLALELLARGGRLVADDQTLLEMSQGHLIARCGAGRGVTLYLLAGDWFAWTCAAATVWIAVRSRAVGPPAKE